MDARELPLESSARVATGTLVVRARQGHPEAVDAICARFRPRLVRWTRGRLPAHARGVNDTEDLVQDVIVAALGRIGSIEPERDGLLRYLQTAILNRVRTSVRNAANRQRKLSVDLDPAPGVESPFDAYVSRENQAKYERGLARLNPEEQDLIIGRIELQMSYGELAIHVGKPSADAARMACKRAIERLANSMRE